MNLLLIESHPELREVIKSYMEFSHNVLSVRCPSDGISICNDNQIDCILYGINLDDQIDNEFHKNLTNQLIPIIIMAQDLIQVSISLFNSKFPYYKVVDKANLEIVETYISKIDQKI